MLTSNKIHLLVTSIEQLKIIYTESIPYPRFPSNPRTKNAVDKRNPAPPNWKYFVFKPTSLLIMDPPMQRGEQGYRIVRSSDATGGAKVFPVYITNHLVHCAISLLGKLTTRQVNRGFWFSGLRQVKERPMTPWATKHEKKRVGCLSKHQTILHTVLNTPALKKKKKKTRAPNTF